MMLEELKQEYQYNELEAMLVLKDILYNVWKNRKANESNKSPFWETKVLKTVFLKQTVN